MKFILNTEQLKKSINSIFGIIGKDNLSQDLIKITGKKDSVILESHQVDFSLKYEFKTKVEEVFSAFVKGEVLHSLINSLINLNVEFFIEKNILKLNTDYLKSEVNLSSGEDYVEVKFKEEFKHSFKIEREILIDGLKKVKVAAATSMVKPELVSVFLNKRRNEIFFVSTDTFRLSESRFEIKDGDGVDISVLIPIKGINNILRVLENSFDSTLEFSVDENFVKIKGSEFELQTNTVNAEFPDYKKIIPKEFDVEFSLLKSDIVTFLKNARFFSDDLNRFYFKLEKSKLNIKFSNKTNGTAESSIPVSDIQGEGELPQFNYKYINDALSVIKDETVRFRFSLSNRILMIRGVDSVNSISIISSLLEEN